jgi:hypothetical protein
VGSSNGPRYSEAAPCDPDKEDTEAAPWDPDKEDVEATPRGPDKEDTKAAPWDPDKEDTEAAPWDPDKEDVETALCEDADSDDWDPNSAAKSASQERAIVAERPMMLLPVDAVEAQQAANAPEGRVRSGGCRARCLR